MENIKDKIIVYLIFARSKLDLQYKPHQKAKKEIDEILYELEKNEDKGKHIEKRRKIK